MFTPNLMLRLGTGLLAGIAAAGFVLPAFNATVWRTAPAAPPFARPLELGAALAAAGA